MTKSRTHLHPLSILSTSSNQLESNYGAASAEPSPQSSRCSSRVSRSPRSSRSAWSRFRRPSTLGYEQTVVSIRLLFLFFFIF